MITELSDSRDGRLVVLPEDRRCAVGGSEMSAPFSTRSEREPAHGMNVGARRSSTVRTG